MIIASREDLVSTLEIAAGGNTGVGILMMENRRRRSQGGTVNPPCVSKEQGSETLHLKHEPVDSTIEDPDVPKSRM